MRAAAGPDATRNPESECYRKCCAGVFVIDVEAIAIGIKNLDR